MTVASKHTRKYHTGGSVRKLRAISYRATDQLGRYLCVAYLPE
jgi:hypothetical protein